MDGTRVEHRQRGHRVRVEWGPAGVELFAAECAVVIVVDVLSFCTSVDIALGRGACVLPQRWGDRAAAAGEAVARGAVPAGSRAGAGPSLRPSSLLGLEAGTRLALPSPNGAALCAMAAAGTAVVFAGCLRNASAVAAAALAAAGLQAGLSARVVGRTRDDDGATDPTSRDGAIGLVPAGERWPDGTLRVAAEDLIGVGAIAAALSPAARSPEAELAVAQFEAAQFQAARFEAARFEGVQFRGAQLQAGPSDAARSAGLATVLAGLSSGRELIGDGFWQDVELAAAYDTSRVAPRLGDGLLVAD